MSWADDFSSAASSLKVVRDLRDAVSATTQVNNQGQVTRAGQPQSVAPAPGTTPPLWKNPLVIGAAVLAVLGVGLLAFRGR